MRTMTWWALNLDQELTRKRAVVAKLVLLDRHWTNITTPPALSTRHRTFSDYDFRSLQNSWVGLAKFGGLQDFAYSMGVRMT